MRWAERINSVLKFYSLGNSSLDRSGMLIGLWFQWLLFRSTKKGGTNISQNVAPLNTPLLTKVVGNEDFN